MAAVPGPAGLTRRRVYEILEVCDPADRTSRLVNAVLVVVIVAAIVEIVLSSVAELQDAYATPFAVVETATVLIFTVEYAARLWASQERGPVWRYVVSPMAVIDLLAILPFYASLVFGTDLRLLKVLRLLRILKLTRYFAPLKMLGDAIKAEARALTAALFVLGILILIAASLMYWAERSVQPDSFGSIPQAMWWSVVTLTTVGYGDVTPVSLPGRVLGVLIMVLGIGVVALPAGMLASRFSAELQKRRDRLEQAVEEAVKAGPLDAEARAILAQQGVDMGLSVVDSGEIVHPAASAEPSATPAVPLPATAPGAPSDTLSCPYCGGPLHLAPNPLPADPERLP